MQSTQMKLSMCTLLLLFLGALVLVFAACKTEAAAPADDTTNNTPPVTYTITVEPKGGTGVDPSYTVTAGQSVNIPEPKAPSASVGFGGWTYTDGSRSVDFVSGQTIPTQSIKIFAIWLPFHTVTIDKNGGTAGNTVTITKILDGATVPATQLVSPPTKTDSEIAYWSTVADVYTNHFEFDSTPVTGDITIYPHWRLTLAAVSKLMEGNWLSYENGSTTISPNLYKLYAANSYLASCEEKNDLGLNYNLADVGNSAKLSTLKTIPIDLSFGSGSHLVSGTNYYVQGNLNSFSINIGTDIGLPYDNPRCTYGTDYKYTLNSYKAKDSTEIVMGQFGAYSFTEEITLKSFSANEFTVLVGGYTARAGTYRLVKTP